MIYSQNVHDYIIWHLLSTHNYLMTYIFHNHATCHHLNQCSIAEFSNSFLVSPSPSVCTINIDGWESCKYRKMKHKHDNLIISQINTVIDTLVT